MSGVMLKIYIFGMSGYQAQTVMAYSVFCEYTDQVILECEAMSERIFWLRECHSGTVVMDKGGIVKIIYKRLLVKDKRTQETAWLRVLEFFKLCVAPVRRSVLGMHLIDAEPAGKWNWSVFTLDKICWGRWICPECPDVGT